MTSLLKHAIKVLTPGFHCQFIQGHCRGLIIKNRYVWPKLFRLNVFTAFKRTHYYILLVVNAAGVIPCDNPKKRPHTAPIVQLTFHISSLKSAEIFCENRKYPRFRFICSKGSFTRAKISAKFFAKIAYLTI